MNKFVGPSSQSILSDFINKGFIELDSSILSNLALAIETQQKLFALPLKTKMQLICPLRSGRSGYFPWGQERASTDVEFDPKEIWHVSRDPSQTQNPSPVFAENIWPSDLPQMRLVFAELYLQLDQLVHELMPLIFKAVEVESPPSGFLIDHNSVIRMSRYQTHGVSSHVLAHPHIDFDLVTIHLHQSEAGLQGKFGNTWCDLKWPAGKIIVTVGQMLARMCNDRVKALEHRVVHCLRPDTARHYMGYFVHPNPEAILHCYAKNGEVPKYAEVSSLELLTSRAQEIQII